MNLASLVYRNLRYQWRGNLAVILGIALGAAVLTGALLVGDSLRGSLLELSLKQLGWVEEVVAPGRLVRQDLADKLPAKKSAGVLLLQGSASLEADSTAPAARTNILGVDSRYWTTRARAEIWNRDDAVVVINEPLARDLNAKVGDRLWLNVPRSDAVPRETLLGKRKSDDVLASIAVTVIEIEVGDGMARFALDPSPEPARNAFVPRVFLQARMDQVGKINAILLAGMSSRDASGKLLDLGPFLSLADWGLKLTTPDDRAKAFVRFLDPRNDTGELRRLKWQGRVPDELAKKADAAGILTEANIIEFYRQHRRYLMLQSDHLYLDATVESALGKAFDLEEPKFRPALIYLADRLAIGAAETPYATIAAVRPTQVPGLKNKSLADDEIAVVDWPGSPLKAKAGDEVQLEYYVPDSRNQLVLKKTTFRVADIIPLDGSADDPDWTPEYPGLTDKLDISGWDNPPFPPYSTRKVMERITPADEDYWKRYRATPKAYIPVAAGQQMWASRFGSLTELRIDLSEGEGDDPQKAAEAFTDQLRLFLDAERGGFVVRNLRSQATRASAGSNDFGGLFLGFSFFLILAALVLVGLLVRLNLERRAAEIGLLSATGWGVDRIARMLRREGWHLIVAGCFIGLSGAPWFAAGMLRWLAVNWPGQGTLQFLTLHQSATSYVIGFLAATVVSLLTLRWAFRWLRRRTPTQLLAGDITFAADPVMEDRRGVRWSTVVLIGTLAGAAAALATSMVATSHEALAGAFFGGGMLVLAALLTLVWRWLNAIRSTSDPETSLVRLGVRNARRNPVRSLLTVGLLAAATFMVVAVQAFHREPAETFFFDHGGSGGFRLFAQTDVPLYQNLADPAVREELDIPPDINSKIEDVAAFRLQPGDDASCLNLYQPLKPRILGVPKSLIAQGRFAFASSLATTDEERANPWLLLNQPREDGSIPTILDANSAQWILKVALGGTIPATNQAGEPVKLRVVALLKESLFQSEVLVSESNFLKLYPAQQGYQFFLIRCPEADQDAVRRSLQTALANNGASVRPTFDRLSQYLAVENTYLATFQALGGLGLLLGAAGLAIVLVRGVWERRAELALLRALGFRGGQLAILVLSENVALLVLGLGVGCLAAMVSVSPQWLGGEANLVWGQMALVLAGVSLVGLGAGTIAVIGSLRTPVLTALRRE